MAAAGAAKRGRPEQDDQDEVVDLASDSDGSPRRAQRPREAADPDTDGQRVLAAVLGSGLGCFPTAGDSPPGRAEWRALAARAQDCAADGICAAMADGMLGGATPAGSAVPAGSLRRPSSPLFVTGSMLRDRLFRHERECPGLGPRDAAPLTGLMVSSMELDRGIGLPFHPAVMAEPSLQRIGCPPQEAELSRWTRLCQPGSPCVVVGPAATVDGSPGTRDDMRGAWREAATAALGSVGLPAPGPDPQPAGTRFIGVSHRTRVGREEWEDLQHAKLIIARFAASPLGPAVLRVVVSSANLSRHGWEEMHQVVWAQDFPAREVTEAGPAGWSLLSGAGAAAAAAASAPADDGGVGSDFGRQLGLLVRSWGGGAASAALAALTRGVDLTAASADLCSSWPQAVRPQADPPEDPLRDGRGWNRLAVCRARHMAWLGRQAGADGAAKAFGKARGGGGDDRVPPPGEADASTRLQVVTSSLGGLTASLVARCVFASRGVPSSTGLDDDLQDLPGRAKPAALRRRLSKALKEAEGPPLLQVAWPSRSEVMRHPDGAGKVWLRRKTMEGRESTSNRRLLARLCRTPGAGPFRNSHAKMMLPRLPEAAARAVVLAASCAGLGTPPSGSSGQGSAVDDWLYAGSANFSQAAWGAPGPELRTRNWESGVVLPPSAWRFRAASGATGPRRAALGPGAQAVLVAAATHCAQRCEHPSAGGATLHDWGARAAFGAGEDGPWVSPEAGDGGECAVM